MPPGGRLRDDRAEYAGCVCLCKKEGPSRSQLRRALRRCLEEESGPALARAVKPWGQGQRDADPMLQRDFTYI